jgi:hypothetical protein
MYISLSAKGIQNSKEQGTHVKIMYSGMDYTFQSCITKDTNEDLCCLCGWPALPLLANVYIMMRFVVAFVIRLVALIALYVALFFAMRLESK